MNVLKSGKTQEYPLSDTKREEYYKIFNTNEHFLPNLSGTDGVQDVPFTTIISKLKSAVEKHGDKPALRWESESKTKYDTENNKYPDSDARSNWNILTWKEYYNKIQQFGTALINCGVKINDNSGKSDVMTESVGIWGFNSAEWIIASVGGMYAGAISMGIYPTDTMETVTYKINHANTSVVCVDSEEKIKKILEVADQLPNLRYLVIWGDNYKNYKYPDPSTDKIKIVHWDNFLSTDSVLESPAFITPSRCCVYVYTSGTTGKPKACMLCHDNLLFTTTGVCYYLNKMGVEGEERILSYLPLTHVAGFLIDIICPIYLSAGTFTGGKGYASVSMARSYDLKKGTLGGRLTCIEPTLFLGVPRVWEKISSKLKAKGAAKGACIRKIAGWAKGKGLVNGKNLQLGGSGKKPSFYGCANILLAKIKKALGLNEVKYCVTGAAPIARDLLEYYASLGLNLLELYGMSETAGVQTANFLSKDEACINWGSVGCPLQGADVRIYDENGSDVFNADGTPVDPKITEGEIVFRSRSIMMGYLANKALGEEHVQEIIGKNKSAMTSDGYLKSGDKGTIINGMFKITGRYKELIITAGGENIAPVPIENHIKFLCPAISNVIMIGDKKKFNICLVTLKSKGQPPGTNDLDAEALSVDSSIKTISDAMDSTIFTNTIKSAIENTNNNKEVCVSRPCKIQKFTILPCDFSDSTGELTPTLKLKRSVTQEKYTSLIDEMYASSDNYYNYKSSQMCSKSSVQLDTVKNSVGEN